MGSVCLGVAGVKMKLSKYFPAVILLLLPLCSSNSLVFNTFSYPETRAADDRQLTALASENIVPIFIFVLVASLLNNLMFGGLTSSIMTTTTEEDTSQDDNRFWWSWWYSPPEEDCLDFPNDGIGNDYEIYDYEVPAKKRCGA